MTELATSWFVRRSSQPTSCRDGAPSSGGAPSRLVSFGTLGRMTDANGWDMDDPVNIEGLDPEEALRLLLAVDPDADPVADDT